jgi:hypothetical protein
MRENQMESKSRGDESGWKILEGDLSRLLAQMIPSSPSSTA